MKGCRLLQPKVVDYYFAPMSGYAYLGHDEFVDICAKAGAEIRYHPLDMGRVFASAGSFPPAKYPEIRQIHRKADMVRWAEKRGLPFNDTPAFWPVPMERACAAIAAAGALGLDQAIVTKAILSAVWVDDLNISNVDDLKTVLVQSGIEADPILSACSEPDTIASAAETTSDAIEMGIFGSPTYVLEDQWYFGQDRLIFLRSTLNQV